MSTKQPEFLNSNTGITDVDVAASELLRLCAENHALQARLTAYEAGTASACARSAIFSADKLATDNDKLHAEITTLHAQLEAVDAGGVEPLRKRCLHQISEPAQEFGHSAQTIAMTANVAGLESSVAHLSCLLDAFRALLVEVDDVCGRDGFDRVLEEGESEIIDKIRAALAMTNAAPQPAAQALDARWVSVDERLPEPNTEVLCAGCGWGDPFVTACYYDDERREWYQINTHRTDATAHAQYPTQWMPLPAPPTAIAAQQGAKP